MANSVIKANAKETFIPTLDSNFEIASGWGWLSGWRVGRVCVVSGSGISSKTELTSDTYFVGVPFTIDSADITTCYIDNTHNAKIRAQIGTSGLYVNGVPANQRFFFQIIFAIR